MKWLVVFIAFAAIGCKSKQPLISKIDTTRELVIEVRDTTIPGLAFSTLLSDSALRALVPGKRIVVKDTTGLLQLAYFKDLAGNLQMEVESKDRTIQSLNSRSTSSTIKTIYLKPDVIKVLPFWAKSLLVLLPIIILVLLLKTFMPWSIFK